MPLIVFSPLWLCCITDVAFTVKCSHTDSLLSPKNWNGCIVVSGLSLDSQRVVNIVPSAFLRRWLLPCTLAGLDVYYGMYLCYLLALNSNRGYDWVSHVALSGWFLTQHVVWDSVIGVWKLWFLMSGFVQTQLSDLYNKLRKSCVMWSQSVFTSDGRTNSHSAVEYTTVFNCLQTWQL